MLKFILWWAILIFFTSDFFFIIIWTDIETKKLWEGWNSKIFLNVLQLSFTKPCDDKTRTVIIANWNLETYNTRSVFWVANRSGGIWGQTKDLNIFHFRFFFNLSVIILPISSIIKTTSVIVVKICPSSNKN
jgi:hypothetical protein